MQDQHVPSNPPPNGRPPTEPGIAGDPARTHRPAVSVIIPTYNRSRLLGEALDSVQRQTFDDYEIVIVDDGSIDDTRARVAARAMPIRYVYQENQGVAEARNHAIRLARGEFLAFLDSDDLWEPVFLERTVRRLRSHPEEVLVYTDFVSVDPTGRPIRGHRKKPCAGDVTQQLFASVFVHTSAVVARRQAVLEQGGFNRELSHNEDYDLWLRLSLRHRFGLVPKPLCRRRCHAESLSRNGSSPQVLLTKARLMQRFYEQGPCQARIDPALAHKRLGKLYYTAAKAFVKAGQPHIAEPVFREALRFDARRVRAWFWRGLGRVSRLWHAAGGR